MLVDFIVELSDVFKDSLLEPLWILETNGSSKAIGGKASIVLQSPRVYWLPRRLCSYFQFQIMKSSIRLSYSAFE